MGKNRLWKGSGRGTDLQKKKRCAASSRPSLTWLWREVCEREGATKEEETSSVFPAFNVPWLWRRKASQEEEMSSIFPAFNVPWLWRTKASQEGREREL
ncbi:hypothetical protein MRB53_019943 [Persea americana]|uniref:Uncharacterized protein n=1 Tax=Persea americana TaxID=3435 RepID=A0ACC2KZG1_PERAE|nr:hypothetical protein MRB53_019943 [Persea americana]